MVVLGGLAIWKRKQASKARESESAESLPLPPLVSGGSWLFGHLTELAGEQRYDTIKAWAEKHGSTFRIRLPLWHRSGFLGLQRAHGVVVMSKEDQLKGLGGHESPFEERTSTDVIFGNLIFSGLTMGWHKGGHDHAQRKKELLKAMAPKVLRQRLPELFACAQEFCDRAQQQASASGGSVEVHANEEMVRIICDMFASAQMTGYRMGSVSRDGPGDAFLNDMDETLNYSLSATGWMGYHPLSRLFIGLSGLLSPAGRQARAARNRFFETAATILAAHEQKEADGRYDERRDGVNIAGVVAKLYKQGKVSRRDSVSDLVNYIFSSHDTGFGMAFCVHALSSRPELQQALREELEVALASCGGSAMDLAAADAALFVSADERLPLFNAVLKESLRLWPAPLWPGTCPLLPTGGLTWRECTRSSSLGGFRVPKDWMVCVPFYQAQRDLSTWGSDAEEFRPERWLQAGANVPAGAYTPFSSGLRACPGMNLGNTVLRVTLATLLLRHDILPARNPRDTSILALYHGGLQCALRPQVREELPCLIKSKGMQRELKAAPRPPSAFGNGHSKELHDKPLLVLYGSNMGTCEELADRWVSLGEMLGMPCSKASLAEAISSDGPVDLRSAGTDCIVAIITSTYNGQAPDNAVDFERWLESDGASATVRNLRFACFGVGNRQWTSTFLSFPRRLQTRLEELGAVALVPMGEGDANSGQVSSAFDAWNRSLFSEIFKTFKLPVPAGIQDSLNPSFEVALHVGMEAREIQGGDATLILEDALARAKGSFLKNCRSWVTQVSLNTELLTDEAVAQGRSTRHIEVALPEGHSYRAGDHLGVWGANPDEVVAAHMDYFRLPHDSVVSLSLLRQSDASCLVPLQRKTDVWSTLAYCFDLQQPASMAQIEVLAPLAACPAERADLEQLSSDAGCHAARVLAGKRTLLEILQAYGSVKLPFGKFLGMLPAMKPRFYSISSSPIKCPNSLSITVSVVAGTTPSGRKHIGVCSNHLKEQPRLRPASVGLPADAEHYMPLILFVKDSGGLFRLPEPNVPVIMVGPGTGVAPMRGFLQERAAQGARENILFFGCRDRHELLYQSELEELQASGYLKLFVALSREPSVPKTYVQNLIEQESDLVVDFLQRGARIYVCGDASRMAPEVRATFQRVAEKIGLGDSFVASMVKQGRYCEDVWA